MNNMGEPMNDAWDSRKHEATPVPLKVNTAVNTAVNKEAVVTSTPLSPTNFRRLTSTSNARQSWVFCKQRPIPETESVVEPTPIIHPRGFSASSRLSILIQGSPGRHMHNPSSPTTFRSSERDRMTETVETAATALTTTTVTINEAPDLEKEVEEVVQTMVEEKAALVSPPLGDSSRYLTNAFDPENDYDGVPYASPSFWSVASSSQSNYTAHRDSISDTSVLSSSPAASEQQPIIARTTQQNGLNLRSLSYSSSFSVQKNRHSMPTAPNIGGQPPPGVGPRRASMPVLSAKESTAGATESLPLTVSPTSIEVSSIQLTPTTFSNEDQEANEDQEENDELTQLEARQRHSFSSSDLIASPTLGNRPQSTISTVSTATFSSMSTTSSMSTAITNITSSNTTDGTEKGVANRSDGPGVNTLRRSGILDTSHARLSSAALYNGRLSVRLSRFSAPTPMQMRQSIALEILTTERHYVECLTLLQRLFLRPLLDSLSTPYPILSKKSITNIFANFLDIVSLNTELLKRLEERIASEIYPWNPEDGCVGDIFLDMGPFFKMYSLYVNNFESALTAIEVQLRERPAFSAFLRDVIKTGQCKGLTFQAYLIMPVQRIPRYKMLVDDLLKKTPESHPDYLNLKKASHVIDHVATFVNETIRQHEMFLKMLDIQRSLSGFDEVLLVPGRKLIKRGTVSKICRKNHQEREFFLFTDILIYASPGLLDDMYNFHRKFDLEDLIVLPLDESAGRNTGFQLLSPQKSFTVYAESTHEKQLWIDAIRETKEEYLSAKRTLKISDNLPEKRATLRKRVVENYYAPFWVPDEKAERCMNCNDEFTMFRRKHHCRACGKVVCHACSTRNFVISGKTRDRDQIVRACDPCFFTMFPDALEDEDLAPGVQVWDSVGYGGSSNASTSPSHVRKASTGTARSDVSTIPSEGGSLGVRLNPFKSVHEAITARQCELCRVDFNVFRWRNVCLKCKKIICSVCLTKKQIDLSQFPPEFMRDVLENQQLLQASRRDSIIGFGNTIKLCDLCYVGIDPNSVEVNEEYGGWTVKGGISPPRTPPATAPASGSADSVVTPNNNANTGTDLRLPPSIAIFHPPTSV